MREREVEFYLLTQKKLTTPTYRSQCGSVNPAGIFAMFCKVMDRKKRRVKVFLLFQCRQSYFAKVKDNQ